MDVARALLIMVLPPTAEEEEEGTLLRLLSAVMNYTVDSTLKRAPQHPPVMERTTSPPLSQRSTCNSDIQPTPWEDEAIIKQGIPKTTELDTWRRGREARW